MFRGFRSPWSSGPRVSPSSVTVNAIAASRNSQSWIATCAARSGDSAPALITSERFWPSRYSMAMKKYFPWVPYSKTVGTYRLTLQNASCSFVPRRSASMICRPSLSSSIETSFSATWRFVRVSVARKTAAIPPLPTWCRISYAPTRWNTVVIVTSMATGPWPDRPRGRASIHEPVVAGQRGARIARAGEHVRAHPDKDVGQECRTAVLLDGPRRPAVRRTIAGEYVVRDGCVRPWTDDEAGARVVVNVAADEPDPGRRIDLDGRRRGAGYFDARHRQLGVRHRDPGAERRRGVANHAETLERGVGDVASLNRRVHIRGASGQPDHRSAGNPADDADVALE